MIFSEMPSITTPLYQTIFFGSIDAAKFLIEHEANVNRPDSHGTPPIVKAAEMGSIKPTQQRQYEEIILSLQKHSADINAKDGNGKTALHRTAYQNNSSMLEFLLRHGANASATDNRGETPLFPAAYRNNEASASALLKYGAQVNVGNIYKWTPLHKTYKWGADKVKKLLLANKANPDALDELGRKPYQATIPEQIYLGLDSFPTLESL
ncbi:MAG: ankyrin repeat domain-containing protein [Alphaproteobacteria bacterium]|nr:ankyrin repeat domain-containing protein [Alphaproteobacteria bacterium]